MEEGDYRIIRLGVYRAAGVILVPVIIGIIVTIYTRLSENKVHTPVPSTQQNQGGT